MRGRFPSFDILAGRLSVPGRALGALGGGYVVTALAVACMARLLPMAPVEASIAATLASFGIFAAIILASFSIRSVLRLWLWLGGAALLLGTGLWLSILAGGRL